MGAIPGLGRSPGGGNGNPPQYFCLENPMDGGAWWATFLRLVLQSWSWLKQLSMCACRHTLRGCGLFKPSRDFSEVQDLRFCAPNNVAWVPSLVRELRSHMLCGIARKKKKRWSWEMSWDQVGYQWGKCKSGGAIGQFSLLILTYEQYLTIFPPWQTFFPPWQT